MAESRPVAEPGDAVRVTACTRCGAPAGVDPLIPLFAVDELRGLEKRLAYAALCRGCADDHFHFAVMAPGKPGKPPEDSTR